MKLKLNQGMLEKNISVVTNSNMQGLLFSCKGVFAPKNNGGAQMSVYQNLTFILLKMSKVDLCKQCRSRSEGVCTVCHRIIIENENGGSLIYLKIVQGRQMHFYSAQ